MVAWDKREATRNGGRTMAVEREFTVSELAQLFGRNEETVRRWRIRGRNGVQLMIPSADDHPGRRGYLIPASAVRAFLEKNPTLTTVAIRRALEGEDIAPDDERSDPPTSAAAAAPWPASTYGAAAVPGIVSLAGGLAGVWERMRAHGGASSASAFTGHGGRPASTGVAASVDNLAPSAESHAAANAAPVSAAPDGHTSDIDQIVSDTAPGVDSEAPAVPQPAPGHTAAAPAMSPSSLRTGAVMRQLLREKLARRDELLLELQQVDEEISVLSAYSDTAPPAP